MSFFFFFPEDISWIQVEYLSISETLQEIITGNHGDHFRFSK